jgi:hypothetical protein
LFLLVLIAIASATHAQDIFVTPVAGAPFSGVIQVQRSMVQADGSTAELRTMREIGRDSRGRIYNESRQLLPASNGKTPEVLSVHLYDPQTRISTVLDPKQKTFWTRTVNRPPATVPPLLHATPSANTLPQNDFTRQEDLGTQEMEGVLAHGVRETQTIPSDKQAKPITVIDEYWYSEELRINVVVKHEDPRSGKVTMRVAQIARTEPDASRFEIPEGYRPAGAHGND